MKYRKKPVIIDAIQFDGNKESMKRIIIDLQMPHGSYEPKFNGTFYIKTLEGTMVANPGDWIIKGVKGEFYPCKPDIFAQSYEKVERIKETTLEDCRVCKRFDDINMICFDYPELSFDNARTECAVHDRNVIHGV